MPYSPPAGNAVDYNFTGLVYAAPLGNSILFNFATGGGGGGGTTGLPSALRLSFTEDEGWFTQPSPARYAPPFGLSVLPYTSPKASGLILAMQEEEPWSFKYQSIVFVPSPITTRRPWLFCT